MREETITLKSGNQFLNITIIGHNGTSILVRMSILTGCNPHPIMNIALNAHKKLFVTEIISGVNMEYFQKIKEVEVELIEKIEKLYKLELELKNGK